MQSIAKIQTYLRLLFLIATGLVLGSITVQAQDTPVFTAPSFTAQNLETQITALESNSDISNDQRDQIKTSLRTAVDRLTEATRQSERRTQFMSSVANADAILAAFELELEAARNSLTADIEPISEMIGEDALFELEQDLISAESELAEVETRLQSIEETLNIFLARQTSAPQELSESRAALSDLQTRLNALGDGELEAVSEARRKEIQAQIWYRRNQIRALEQEIATLPKRQELLLGRRAKADIDAQIIRKEVSRLSVKTGQKRVNDAREQRERIAASAASINIDHPLVVSYFQDNLELADQITTIAQEAPLISQATASVRGWGVEVESDLSAATNLVEQGRLDREAGDTLRRLGNQLQTPDSIRAAMRDTQDRLGTATRQRIIAQEDLRDLPNGALDLDLLVDEARRDMPTLPDLSESEKDIFSAIIDTRRDLLRQISTLSNIRINAVSELRTAQQSLLNETESLQTLLDENLLWVRSVPAIDFGFPKKVSLGAFEFFSPRNFALAATEAWQMAKTYVLIVLSVIVTTLVVYRVRPEIRLAVDRRASMVGRVQHDSAWHTPMVVAAGLFHALPLALIFLVFAFLFWVSDNPNLLMQSLMNGFLYLSLFTLLFGACVRWNREGGLFDAHFDIPSSLRRVIGQNLRWFIPVMGISSALLVMTSSMTEENIAEGLSLFLFIITGLSLMVFAGRLLWAERDGFIKFVSEESLFLRFRGFIAVFIIGMPLVTIGMAATGYFESANKLLTRMFLTGVLIVLTYVVYGAIRRAIIVAQRQLKYLQAAKKREAELKARRDKLVAEERGEDLPPPPPVNTAEIDVSTITRQSSKLLRTFSLLGFAVLLWMIWSSLFPALSIFDGVDVWSYKTGALDDNNNPVEIAVTLWDVLRSLGIIILTFIAARNLPGFLEIFVLNRFGVEAGTRYAVTTVLGYVIIAMGVLIGLDQLGLQWSQLKWIATGLSVGIGFGLQKIIANFISGLIILFERPIRIGDYVTIGEQSGTVSRIQIRATTLKDLDNLEILIPNEALISERVTNWTLSSSITRLIVPVGIAYGSKTDVAREIMLSAVKDLPKVLKTPAPNVLFMGFGESSLDFEIRVFLNSFDDRVPMTHIIHTEINKALEAAGISIPFPQRDLNIISQTSPSHVSPKSPKRKTPKSK